MSEVYHRHFHQAKDLLQGALAGTDSGVERLQILKAHSDALAVVTPVNVSSVAVPADDVDDLPDEAPSADNVTTLPKRKSKKVSADAT